MLVEIEHVLTMKYMINFKVTLSVDINICTEKGVTHLPSFGSRNTNH